MIQRSPERGRAWCKATLQVRAKLELVSSQASPVASQQCGKPEFDLWVGKIPLEKGMATHSSILAWRVPWTEEPGGLQSTGSQRVGHDSD